MTSRKKNLLLIQITIFLIASLLLYNTYSDKNEIEKEDYVRIEAETNTDINSFTDIEYSGFDLNGNRYVIRAEQANFKTETPELINMEKVVTKFYLKDGKILTVISDEAVYNNITLNMDFKNNVRADYLTHFLLSDSISYSNTNATLIASGNVRGESVKKGEFTADNVEYDFTNKTLNFSMIGSKQVNVKVKNK